ncbi:MAG: cation diffusion facilitator family transporter [Gammaproteobacteria bacterium]|nr:cation diffusion facilitator family transporter [Gammaproteobacteria bacterium]
MTEPSVNNGVLMRRATYASVATAATLVIAKLVAWAMTGSVALLSSLVDSLLDALASIINLVAVRHALTPADREHRFGHGKAEPLAGLAQAAFIAGSAVFLVVEACARLVHPKAIEFAVLGIGVMVFSIVLTIILVRYQRYVVKATASVAIGADLLHYVGDVLVNGGVILALVLSTQFGWIQADPIIALAIAAYILKSVWAIVVQSLRQLMDEELPEAQRQRIAVIARNHAEVTDLHDLRTRVAGQTTFIQLHLEMDGRISLARAHAIADEVHDEVLREFPHAEILIHQDPAGLPERDRDPIHDGGIARQAQSGG